MPRYSHVNITLHEFDFLRHYADLASETFGNAYQSALKAGYSVPYARVIKRNYPISRREWLKSALKDEGLMKIIEATRHMDFGVPIKPYEEIRHIVREQERELIGMTAEEVIRGLDELLGDSI